MRVVWAPLAVGRAEEAARFIARDKPGAARRWARGLLKRVGQLTVFPESGRVVPELRRPDLRELIHHSYRVIYRVTPSEVRILTVRHCARQLDEEEIEPCPPPVLASTIVDARITECTNLAPWGGAEEPAPPLTVEALYSTRISPVAIWSASSTRAIASIESLP